MKKKFPLLFVILASGLSAATFPYVRVNYGSCPSTIIAGYTTMCGMRPLLAFNATVDPTTDVFTLTGGTATYTPTTGDIVTAESSGAMPARMDTMLDGVYPNWDVCDISVLGSVVKFKLRQDPANYAPPGPCTGRYLDVTTAGTGTLTLSLFQFKTKVIYMNGNPTGFPAGTTFDIWSDGSTERNCNTPAPASKGKTYSPGESIFCFKIHVPPNATLGPSIAHFNMCDNDSCSGSTGSFDWPINVIAGPNISHTPPTSFPPMPGKNKWESRMTARPCPLMNCDGAGPANYCHPLANPPLGQLIISNFTIGMYGWQIFWHWMAQYTGNKVYVTGCGKSSADQIRDAIVRAGGSAQQCCHWTSTMYLAERAFGGGTYKAAGNLMINNSLTRDGPIMEWGLFREDLQALKDDIALKFYGGITNPRMQDHLDAVISQCLSATETGPALRPQQGFFLGLAADALEEYLIKVAADDRIPYVVRRMEDYVWNILYDSKQHIAKNIAAPDGSPFCSGLPYVGYWFLRENTGNCNTYPANYQHLQMMMAPMFYWDFAYTGSATQRGRGDDLFAHAWDHDNPDGKSESEDFFLSFQGVAWRTGTRTALQYYGDTP